MNWTELLTKEIEDTYKITDALLGQVDGDKLDWKPETGSNWMTTGQLLQHISNACGGPCKGFITGDWGLPEGMDMKDMKPEDMIPPADAMPAATSIESVRQALADDKKLALGLIVEAGEEDLANKPTTAPWDPNPMGLGYRMLHMVGHLNNHKNQLFYYLKLQGKPVNTWHMYGG